MLWPAPDAKMAVCGPAIISLLLVGYYCKCYANTEIAPASAATLGIWHGLPEKKSGFLDVGFEPVRMEVNVNSNSR